MNYKVYYAPEYFEHNTIKTEDPAIHKDYTYSDCPVWKHRFNRTFIGYSPCDFTLKMEEYKIQYKIDDEDPVEINLKDYENDDEYDDGKYTNFLATTNGSDTVPQIGLNAIS